MKKLLATLSLLFLLAAPVQAASLFTTDDDCTHPFMDASAHDYIESICFLYNQGVIQGHSERNFLPDHYITRAEFLKIAILSLSYDVSSFYGNGFTDVKPGDWHYRYVAFAKDKGWIKGYPDGSFQPNRLISRAESITLMMNMSGIIGPNPPEFSNFYDVRESDWFSRQVSAANQYEILSIFEPYLRPHDQLTRAEATVIATGVWDAIFGAGEDL